MFENMSGNKSHAMKSLLAHYDSGSGSEAEDEEQEDVQHMEQDSLLTNEEKDLEKQAKQSVHTDDEFSEEDDDEDHVTDPIEYHRQLTGKKPEDIKIPKAPRGSVDPLIQEKMLKLKEKKDATGMDMKYHIQKRKDFRNPSIYEKLIDHCGIEEFGSNFPPEVFDPHSFEPDSYYEKLSQAQKVLMDAVAKEAVSASSLSSTSSATTSIPDKPKVVEIITGTAKKTISSVSSSSSHPSSQEKRKKQSKWDEGPSTKLKLDDK